MHEKETQNDLAAKNQRSLRLVLLSVFAMIGLSFASVPLYDLFCRVTGFGGTTQEAKVAPPEDQLVKERSIKIRFNTDTSPKLPWSFESEISEMSLYPGQQALVNYVAQNKSDQPVTGTAIYNVAPVKAGQYFYKTQCFCFDRQTLTPNESMNMPVAFFIDPEIFDDPEMQDVRQITLSYTFFVSDSQELDVAKDAFYARP
jgi:cytochrome c oxidase assembly protein subunit 11